MYSADFKKDHAVPWTSAVKVSVLSAVSRFRSVRRWTPDTTVLPAFTIVEEHVVRRIKECAAANPGLKFFLNGQEISAV